MAVAIAILATSSWRGEGIFLFEMSASALPALSDLQGLATVDDLRGFLYVDDNLWNSILHQIGNPGPHIRVVAALPPQVLVQSCVSATLANGDNLIAIQAAHASARKMGHGWAGLPEGDLKDMDPWATVKGNQDSADQSAPTSNAGGTSRGQVKERVLKMSSPLDQGDGSYDAGQRGTSGFLVGLIRIYYGERAAGRGRAK